MGAGQRKRSPRAKDPDGLGKVMKAVSIDRPPCRCFDYAPQVAIRLHPRLQRRRICSALITLNPWPNQSWANRTRILVDQDAAALIFALMYETAV